MAVIDTMTATYPIKLQAPDSSKCPKTKLGVFGEIIIENKILKTIQRISHTSTMVLPPLNPFENQQPHA
ncbi:hypothetical protein [Vibrio splendidus]|uniref:hypothetical protein n=1 Tax=Vibrio splendidus TaxID=29497 RepID=UPI001054F7D6|nr:hypothetical protein [Vibrio splendidus]